jgi:hypothetical protein
MESGTEKGGDWIDFKETKARAQVRPVLDHFGILEHLEERGAELVGWCPFGKEHGKGDSFAFNVEKRSFQCFACKSRGSILDFVAKHQGVNLREAAKIVLGIMGGEGAAGPVEEKRAEAKGRPYNSGSAGSATPRHPEIPKLEAARRTKQEEPRGDGGSALVFSWDHARFLIEAGLLNPARVVVLDAEALETFLRETANPEGEAAS